MPDTTEIIPPVEAVKTALDLLGTFPPTSPGYQLVVTSLRLNVPDLIRELEELKAAQKQGK